MTQAELVSSTKNNVITYEMPLNDAIRICLRLENVFQQFEKTAQDTSSLALRNAMNALLKILEITDRPDIKSKLSQTLMQYGSSAQFKKAPPKDLAGFQDTLKNLSTLNAYLHSHHARLGETLRQNEFLAQIRSNLMNPGGVCDYRLPAYMLWQNKSPTEKTNDLMEWMQVFQPLREITESILLLSRDGTPLETVETVGGLHIQPLNPTIPCHLVRVIMPVNTTVYPEFSAGKHRLTIRFLTPNYFGAGKSTHMQESIRFQLACCKI